MRRMSIVLGMAAGVVVMALVAGPLGAEDAQQVFQGLYGEKAGKVTKSADKKDDVDFAKEMLTDVEDVADMPGLQVLLCEKAHEFGIRDKSGYATAVSAMKRMVELAPDRHPEAENKLAEVYTLQFRKSTGENKRLVGELLLDQLITLARRKRQVGKPTEAIALYRRAYGVVTYLKSLRKKEILDEIRVTRAEQKIEREIERLEKAIKKNPDDRSVASKLLVLYVVSRDEPQKAVSLLRAAQADEHFKTYVPLAAGDPNRVARAVCVELGSWYEGLVKKAQTDAGKVKMLLRAKTYHTRFLKLYAKKDAETIKARFALRRIEKQLDKLAGRSEAGNVAGVLLVAADDACEVRINGKLVLQTDMHSGKSAKVTLNPDDLITAELMDTRGRFGFCLVFQGEGADVEFSSNTRSWSIYKPAIATSWWKTSPGRKTRRARRGDTIAPLVRATRMAPRPLQTPCQVIWGVGQQCYLYHVVTPDELRGSGLKWVSADATYTASSNYPKTSPRLGLLTGKGGLDEGLHAFYTKRQAAPYIVITLKKAFSIKRITIENSRDPGLYSGARGLTVWFSSDRKRWKPIWTAKKVQTSWRIDLKTPVTARYVKIGLRRTDHLHLAGVRIYAK